MDAAGNPLPLEYLMLRSIRNFSDIKHACAARLFKGGLDPASAESLSEYGHRDVSGRVRRAPYIARIRRTELSRSRNLAKVASKQAHGEHSP